MGQQLDTASSPVCREFRERTGRPLLSPLTPSVVEGLDRYFFPTTHGSPVLPTVSRFPGVERLDDVPGAALELYEARPLVLLAALSRMAVGELPGWSLRAGGDG